MPLAKIIKKSTESLSESVVVTDKDGLIVWVNNAFTKMTGYSEEEAIGKNPRILKSGIQDENFYKDLWGVISKGLTWRGKLTNKRKDGSLYKTMSIIDPVVDENGVITNYICIQNNWAFCDISTREIALGEQFLLTAFDVAEVAMFIMTPEGYIQKANRLAKNMFGYENMIGMNFREFTHPEDIAMSNEYHQKIVIEHNDFHTLDKRYITKNGDIIYGRVVAKVVKDGNNNIVSMISQVKDFTKERRLEEDILKRAKEVEDANNIFKVVSEISEYAINQDIFNLDDILSIAGKNLNMTCVFIQSCQEEMDIYKSWKHDIFESKNFANATNKKQLAEWVSEGVSFIGRVEDLPVSLSHLSAFERVESSHQVYVVPMKIKHKPWGISGFINRNGHYWSLAEREALLSLARILSVMVEGNWEKAKLIQHINLRFEQIDYAIDHQSSSETFHGESAWKEVRR